ncbi:uncharacterized protein [Drosophila bipectinata]|uniref:uncharacterized protein isoform X2 n=2 Tax=Drosophila bipectinata TaxID=42026 RepID=UPI001C893576|nr:uncharacterized protein LOC108124676 [Drosophila bipectinata]
MSRVNNTWRRIVRLFRRNYNSIGHAALTIILLVFVFDQAYVRHGCDLLWWRNLVLQEEISAMSIMLNIAAVKMTIISGLTLFSYFRPAANNRRSQRPKTEDMPISYVRRRYCRFIVMRLVASVEALGNSTEEEYIYRHMAFCDAVEVFRWDARKLFERNDLQLSLPLHQVLVVEDAVEEALLQDGYAEKLKHLRELDIYRMVYDTVF